MSRYRLFCRLGLLYRCRRLIQLCLDPLCLWGRLGPCLLFVQLFLVAQYLLLHRLHLFGRWGLWDRLDQMRLWGL